MSRWEYSLFGESAGRHELLRELRTYLQLDTGKSSVHERRSSVMEVQRMQCSLGALFGCMLDEDCGDSVSSVIQLSESDAAVCVVPVVFTKVRCRQALMFHLLFSVCAADVTWNRVWPLPTRGVSQCGCEILENLQRRTHAPTLERPCKQGNWQECPSYQGVQGVACPTQGLPSPALQNSPCLL